MGNKSTHPSISRNVPPERLYQRAWGQWENHASTTRMTAPAQMPERRHTDPPWLWVACSLGAVVIHLLAFWILQLVMVRQQSVEISTEPIPIELIDIPEPQTVPEKAAITSTPKAQNQPESDSEKGGELEKEKIDQNSSPDAVTPSVGDRIPFLPRRRTNSLPQLASKPIPIKAVSPTTPADSTQPNSSPPISGSVLPKPLAVPKGVRRTTAELPKPPSFQPPPTTPAAAPTASNSSPVPGSVFQKPDSVASVPGINSDSQASPSSASNQASPQPPEPPSQAESTSDPKASESQRDGGIVATLSNIRLVDATRDVPTQQAKPKLEEKQISSISYLPQLSKNLDGVLVLQVTLLIDRTGTPEVLSTKVLQGSSSINPEPLARDIIQDWKFEPAYMGGEPVDQEYFVSLKISPLLN
jgi:hypothetical protein